MGGANYRKLADRLGDLADIPSRASVEAARDIAKLIDAEFNEGEDPYGRRWEPLAEATIAMGRRPPPLTYTRAMREAIVVHPKPGSGIEITVGPGKDHRGARDYAKFHQTGTSNMPRRPILPDGNELPEEWQAAIGGAVTRGFRKAMGG